MQQQSSNIPWHLTTRQSIFSGPSIFICSGKEKSYHFMVVHLDKKWVWCLVVRTFNKLILYFGILPTYHNQYTKNKILSCQLSDFSLKTMIQRKGWGIFLNFLRARQDAGANCTTYHWLCHNDSTYTISQIPTTDCSERTRILCRYGDNRSARENL